MPAERAILSVYDKTGIVDLARFLTGRGVEILSTGGTARHLTEAGIEVTPISKYTGAPEILGGRVKSLHPRVFGGILFDRANEAHRKDVEQQGIGEIGLVVVNLYPFEATIAREGVTLAEAIEQIDIGGPSMLRAAAKNFRNVVVLCNPESYEEYMTEARGGALSEEFRKRSAAAVFEMTSRYDAAIATFLSGKEATASSLPDELELSLHKVQELRYGENPQQSAAFYRAMVPGAATPFVQLQGKELSYNNLLDLDAAWKLAQAFDETAAAVIKHTNPAGAAKGSTIGEALKRAIETDPVSAFGGIVATNREFDAAAAEAVGSLFLEVVVAPSFSEDALARLEKKKNLRIIVAEKLETPFEIRAAAGGFLVQKADVLSTEGWRVASKKQPNDEQMASMKFAWSVCMHVKSNAIVLAKENQLVGVGAGQMSRVDSCRIAVMKANLPTMGTVAASDAFFPFRDGVDVLAEAGVTAVIQPGGSVRDEEVVAAADERGLVMVFTGERHFRH
ncbi:MAG: bifunctional phosphoribosylaminoimidazolecarboxamide formyltransferase/IMP cyclohydrolase [Thermoanaerobaculia bacterium]